MIGGYIKRYLEFRYKDLLDQRVAMQKQRKELDNKIKALDNEVTLLESVLQNPFLDTLDQNELTSH
jgi:predicted site-specific integrase-resolvase